jgi:uncharacterized membrane protein YkvA (DUF1232 family)
MSRKVETTKDKMVVGLAFLCLIYILNPSFGIFEILPDNLPLIGNLDEGLATTLLLWCLNYFGYNVGSFFNKK